MGSRRVARRGLGRLGQDDGGGFNWSNFATSIASSAASGAATAGVNLLKNIGTPSAPKPVAPPPAPTLTTTAAGVPIYVWVLGGFGLLMIMMLAMRR